MLRCSIQLSKVPTQEFLVVSRKMPRRDRGVQLSAGGLAFFFRPPVGRFLVAYGSMVAGSALFW